MANSATTTIAQSKHAKVFPQPQTAIFDPSFFPSGVGLEIITFYFWVSAIYYPFAMMSRKKSYFPVAEETRVVLERKWCLSRWILNTGICYLRELTVRLFASNFDIWKALLVMAHLH